MHLFDHIDLAKKFGDTKTALVESAAQPSDKTAVALITAKRLAEAKQPESEPTQLRAMPVPN